MARRQTEIPGTRTDKDVPLPVVEAGDKFLVDRREATRAKERRNTSLAGLIALMKASNVPSMKLKDPDSGIWLKINAKTVDKLSVVRDRDGEEETEDFEVGEGIADDSTPSVHPNLIAQAEADSRAANVEVSDDGDVGVPDKAAPKAKRGRKAKKSATASAPAELDGDDPVVTTSGGKKRSVPKRNATTPADGEASN